MSSQTIVVAIAGASGSGKTSLASRLCNELESWFRVAVLNEDSYYRCQSDMTLEQREMTNYDHPDAIEETLLVRQLRELKAGNSVKVPIYDYEIHDRSSETTDLGPCVLLIVEGILLLHRKAVCELVDLKVFVDVPESICLERRIRRDVAKRGRTRESVLKQYEETVGPMFRQYVEPSKENADLVVENSSDDPKPFESLMKRIQEIVG